MRFLFASLTLTLLLACSAKPDIVRHTPAFSDKGTNYLYIVSHGWHTGFVVPAKDIQARLPELKKRFRGTPYIEFGWGDKGFYQANEITTGLTLRAIFWPTPSVIHAVAVPNDVKAYFNNSEIEMLCLTDSELSSLIDFLVGSFYINESEEIVPLKNGIYGNSQFYKGAGDYYLMNTCNKWTAKGLKSIGMDISPTFKLTASSVISYIQNREKHLTNCSTNNPITLGSVIYSNDIN